jgi:predicted RecA/RadA family phage recombinase
MKNFVQRFDNVPLAVPYTTITAGQGMLVGALFGVAVTSGVQNDVIATEVEGVFDLTKEPSLAISVGARVFWDNTNRRVTTTATSNFCIGVATVAALAADTTVRVGLGPRVVAGS